jgi:hypothetical protein
MAYQINAPIIFQNTNGGTDTLNFDADGPTTNTLNKVQNFVVTSAGDILYRASGSSNYLERLAIGTPNQVLTVSSGLPAWADPTSLSEDIFTAYVTGSVTGIPTSQSAGANANTWFVLSSSYITWSTSSPGVDTASAFNPTTGAYVIPSTGTYSFCAVVSFDPGSGVNSGAGISQAPAGLCIRQVQIYNSTTSTAYETVCVPVAASNQNFTAISISSAKVPCVAGNNIVVRVRHDMPGSSTATIGGQSVLTQTYFSGQRIH